MTVKEMEKAQDLIASYYSLGKVATQLIVEPQWKGYAFWGATGQGYSDLVKAVEEKAQKASEEVMQFALAEAAAKQQQVLLQLKELGVEFDPEKDGLPQC